MLLLPDGKGITVTCIEANVILLFDLASNKPTVTLENNMNR